MRSGTFTNQGNREINEDSCVCVQAGDRTLCVVADGLGGHGRGEVASALAVETMKKVFEESAEIPMREMLDRAILQCQENLLQEQKAQGTPHDLKTTVVAVCTDGKSVCWGHVGDSRLYAFRKNKVALRTLDHSIPQMLVLSRDIPERKIRNHPQRNMLLRVLGVEWDRPKHELSEEMPVADFQAFLLCSDGFWELIVERQMGSLLKKSATPQEWLEKMAAVVAKNGRNRDMDNYTAVALWL